MNKSSINIKSRMKKILRMEANNLNAEITINGRCRQTSIISMETEWMFVSQDQKKSIWQDQMFGSEFWIEDRLRRRINFILDHGKSNRELGILVYRVEIIMINVSYKNKSRPLNAVKAAKKRAMKAPLDTIKCTRTTL